MHSLLEAYLSEVEAHLSALPAKRRNEEMREIHAHLLSSVEAYQGLGETEREAVESTLRQFGPPTEVAGGLTRAWRRGSWQDKARAGLFGAASLWGVYGFCGLMGQYLERHPQLFDALRSHSEPIFYALLFGLPAVLGGLFAGRSARAAVKGTSLGTGLGYVGPIVVWEIVHAWKDADIIGMALIVLLQAACLTGAAWAVSRHREARARLARG